MSEPLSVLVSQILTALSIETDNEYEHRAPHFTSDYGPKGLGGAWLTSVATYGNFLRLVPDDGIRMGDLAVRSIGTAPVHPAYHGMRRWGYVTYTPDIAGSTPKQKDAEVIVRLTLNGRVSRDTWSAVIEEMELRWADRGLAPLRAALIDVVARIERPLPEYLPALGHLKNVEPIDRPADRPASELSLLSLLSKTSLAITLAFEANRKVSLATCAALLEPIGDDTVLVRDLPDRSGIAKKEWGSAVGQLEKRGLLEVVAASSGSGKAVRLTATGHAAVTKYASVVAAIEPRLHAASFRAQLEAVVGEALAWTKPYPDGWRGKVRPPLVMPRQVMPMHRGCYLDGS